MMLCSCGHIFTKSHTYQKSSTVGINGAQIGASVRPVGGKSGFALSAMVYMAGSATLDGPFIWRVEAEGHEGVHQSMVVHRVKVITSKTRRSEWYPANHLGYREPFKPFKKEPGKCYAVFQIPGKLKVYPLTDGDITILADVSVTSANQTQRRLVKFQLQANTTKDVEFINLPAEIVKGAQKDPREWQW
ncbi:MAG: hypothetical protein H7A51_08085 [Akkermansiaceae bacterium]|nr:hypothetical protein [Akkermansiaceae bacterium]